MIAFGCAYLFGYALTVGLLVADPVNVFLVHRGVKEGLQNPTELRPPGAVGSAGD